MSKNVNWWWVVATRVCKNVTKEECDALGMNDFLEFCMAARVFTSKRQADEWINKRKRLNGIPNEIELRIVSDEAWKLILDMYIRGKLNGVAML